MQRHAQPTLTSFFPAAAPASSPASEPPTTTLTPEQRERVARNRQAAVKRRQESLRGSASPAVAAAETAEADVPEEVPDLLSSPAASPPEPGPKRPRLAPDDATSSPPAAAAPAPAARRSLLDSRAFVPAPLNEAGLLQRETTALREQQQNREKKELRYGWLADPTDPNGCRPGDPDHDPRRLYVPPNALGNMTDFERQYWEIKKDNWDVVVFFKKGKFYELYEGDADIGHQHFGLKMTPRVNMRMVGVPEASFGTWCKQFIYKGYKVGRVEQMEYRLKKQAGDRSLVQRQLCQIITLGTLTEEDMLLDHRPNYLLALREDAATACYGVCFVDASRGEFHLARLEDTAHRGELATLLHRCKPKELIVERDNLSKASLAMLRREVVDPIVNKLVPGKEFWAAAETRRQLDAGSYFADGDRPEALTRFWEDDLVMSALGGCVCYLRRLKLDEELLAMRQMAEYNSAASVGRHMVLDGPTLANLEVLENTRDKGGEGTLLQYLSHCVTPMGKREFRRWLCNPLRHVRDINERLDAVEELIHNAELRAAALEGLRGLPDLERLVSRVFAGGRDVQQVAWVDAEVASRKQVTLFLSTVGGLRRVWTLWQRLIPLAQGLASPYLRRLCSVAGAEAGRLPDVAEPLEYFETSFDVQRVREEGLVIPNKGVSKEYDAATRACNAIERTLTEILNKYRAYFQDDRVVYRAVGKEQHQIEVPGPTLARCRSIPKEFTRMSETKAVQRFWTPEVQELSRRLKEEQMKRDDVLAGILRGIMNQFGQRMAEWLECARLAAELDCVLSLATASFREGMCRPRFVEEVPGRGAVFRTRALRHPCVRPALGSRVTTVVPNDVSIGGEDPLAILLTGPNMGGKSTAMRAVCLAAVMAQLGCYVCAEECELSAVDRIFTRIGATDRIMAGQSTFMVELEETATILQHATAASLVILDELGRGTSTFDGYAIAYSTLKHIAQRIRCRTVFSTHYHFLTEEMARECAGAVAAYHMHYALDPATGEVTFLYQLRPGVCQKSYGIDVARKAGVLSHVLVRAQQRAAEFEAASPLTAASRDRRREALLGRLHRLLVTPNKSTDAPDLQADVRAFLSDDLCE